MNEPIWKQPDGDPVSCIEKLEVLNENYRELRELMQDVFEDALLMDCHDKDIKEAFHQAVEKLQNPYHPAQRQRPGDMRKSHFPVDPIANPVGAESQRREEQDGTEGSRQGSQDGDQPAPIDAKIDEDISRR